MREVAHDLITALLSSRYQRYKTTQSRTPCPFVGILILDYGLNPFQVPSTYRSQDLAEVFCQEVAAERIQQVAGKRCEADHKRVSASLAELRQQKHGIQMGHVIALGVELRCPVHGVLEDVEKLRDHLLPARHGRFDGGSCEFSLESFELLQNFGGFHCGRSKNTVFVGSRQSFLLNRGSDLRCPTSWTPQYAKMILRQCLESTLGRSSLGFVRGHSDGEVRISPASV